MRLFLQTINRYVQDLKMELHLQFTADGATVTNATDFSGWGEAVNASTVTLEPGLWSLSNFGEVLVATIANGKTFTWNAGITARLTTRASTTTSGFSTSNNPTATRVTLISPTTRHLIHFGTEETIGTPSNTRRYVYKILCR